MTFTSTFRNLTILSLAAFWAPVAVAQTDVVQRTSSIDERDQSARSLATADRAGDPAPQISQRRASQPRSVRSGSSGTELSLYGQVNRALLRVNDGNGSDTFFVDNANSSTRLGLRAEGSVSKNLTIGSTIEFEIVSNSSSSVSLPSDGSLGSASFNDRRLEVYGQNAAYGNLWLGQGHTASDGVAEVDLTRTNVVTTSDIPDLAGNIRFDGSGPRINQVFTNMDGLGRDDRIRYDTPLWNGFRGSYSYVGGGAYDLAVRFRGRVDEITLAAAAGLTDESSNRSDNREQYVASVSAKHRNGWSGTLAIGIQTISATRDPFFYYTKLAYEIPGFFGVGRTVFAVDLAGADDIASVGDEFISFGAYVVQIIDRAGADVYVGIRNHQLDRSSTTFDDILAIMAGVRLKF